MDDKRIKTYYDLEEVYERIETFREQRREIDPGFEDRPVIHVPLEDCLKQIQELARKMKRKPR